MGGKLPDKTLKFSTLTALATIFGALALPAILPAQGPGSRGGSDQFRDRRDNGRRDNGRRGNDRRDNDRRGSDRRDDDRRNDSRRGNDRRDDDRRDNDRRNDSRRDNDRWNDRQNDDRRDSDRRNDYQYGQGGVRRESDRRQDTKNEWRNIAMASGAILGLLQGDNTLTFGGAAGALYSLNRYEQDRRSQNQFNRTRANSFSHQYFTRNGIRYDRKEVNRNGQRYYQFVRGR